jgi:hypothetical protein
MPIRPELRCYYRPPDWPGIRERARQRAGDCCERCGAVNGTYQTCGDRAVLVQCGAAHLDHDPANNGDENVAWLCRRCHLAHDSGQHRETRCARKDAARPLLAGAREMTI